VLKRLGRTKVSVQLEEAFFKWLDNHDMVIQSLLASDTLPVSDQENPGNKKRMNKILLQIPVRELHNDLLSTDSLTGLQLRPHICGLKKGVHFLTAFVLWPSINGHFWGYIFSGAYLPQKLDIFPPFSHDTSSFKDTCLLIKS
jgi:hypothetical protein